LPSIQSRKWNRWLPVYRNLCIDLLPSVADGLDGAIPNGIPWNNILVGWSD
jgi:hypothetical protein